MPHDISIEPLFPLDEIQGDILTGLPKRHEHLIVFRITDAAAFKAFLSGLDITSMRRCLQDRADIAAQKLVDDHLIPTPGLNVAFTFEGLKALGIPHAASLDPGSAFVAGMASRHAILNDPPSTAWTRLRPSAHLHGVFVVTGASHAEVVDVISLRLAPADANGWHVREELAGRVRPEPVVGHEHFGFADGVSQPGIRGRIADDVALNPGLAGSGENQAAPGQDVLWPGEFVFGFPGQDPKAKSFPVKGHEKVPPISFMRHGAFLVVRRLAQLVPEFNASVKRASAAIPAGADPAGPELLGAQLVGRWKSGAPIVNAPTRDDRSIGDGTPRVNDFEFGDDRHGLRCPWAAHIRKAYPRDDVPDDVNPADDEAVARAEAETQSHRMLRRGIAFGPEVTEAEAWAGLSSREENERGLLFKCYVTSIEDQFEFVQQSWSDTEGFSQPGSGIDPIIGQSPGASRPFRGAAPFSNDPARTPELSLGSFVEMQGGAYFFAPSIKELKDFAGT